MFDRGLSQGEIRQLVDPPPIGHPELRLVLTPTEAQLTWHAQYAGWTLELSDTLEPGSWQAVGAPNQVTDGKVHHNRAAGASPQMPVVETLPVDTPPGSVGYWPHRKMFLCSNKRFKDGKEHRYWSVVENRRVAGGRSVQKSLLYLGEINDSDRAAWSRAIEAVDERRVRNYTTFAFFGWTMGDG